MSNKTILDEAFRITEAGFKIFPVRSKFSKKPYICGFTQGAASSDRSKVEEWWGRWPDANIGMLCSEDNGICVVDIDPKNGGNEWYDENEWVLEPYKSNRVWSGSGGQHFYFSHPEGVKSKLGFARGVDLLAKNRYVIVPPSIHPFTGKAYNCKRDFVEMLLDVTMRRELPPEGWFPEDSTPVCLDSPLAGGRELTDGDRELLVRRLQEMDGAGGRHNSLGLWTVDAVAAGMSDAEITFRGEEWMVSQGREPQPNEVANWISTAKEKLGTGSAYISSGGLMPDVLYSDAVKPVSMEAALSEEESKAQKEALCYWEDQLQLNKHGAVKASLYNCLTIIRMHKGLHNRLAFCELTQTTHIMRPLPWMAEQPIPKYGKRWDDLDTLKLCEWLAMNYGEFPKTLVDDTVHTVALDHSWHPIRDFLNSLNWDGEPRLDRWLVSTGGAEDCSYVRNASAKTMIGAVARVYEPGCKLDTVLVLEGSQGTRKTTTIRALAMEDQWFQESIGDIDSKDAVLQMSGSWLVAFDELTAYGRSSQEKLKQFFSAQSDKIRPPYGRSVRLYPRQTAYFATTNRDEYLNDPTGSRRFWPVKLRKKIDFDWVVENRVQLWAEAVARYKAGERWYMDGDEEVSSAEEAQSLRQDVDVWDNSVSAMLQKRLAQDSEGFVTAEEIFAVALSTPINAVSKREHRRLVSILTRHGWAPSAREEDGITVSGYAKKPKDYDSVSQEASSSSLR